MPDDLRYARQVAERFGVDLQEIEIAPDVLDLLPRMTYHLDEPIGDPAAINTFLICSAAREAGVKVMLSGMGADELFAGYRKHLANLLALRYQRVPRPLRRGRCRGRGPAAGRHGPPRGTGRCASRSGSCPSPICRRRPRSGAATPCTTGRSCSACSTRTWPATVDDVLTEHADVYQDNDLDDFVNRMCLARRPDVPAGPQPRLHRPVEHGRVDRGAGAVRGRRGGQGGVRRARRRARSSDGRARRSLKEAASSILPREIVYRPKGLFSAPLRAWMSRDLAPLVREVVNDGVLVRSGLPAPGRAGAHGRRGRRRAAGLLQASVARADPRVLVPRRDLRVRPDSLA